MVKLALAFLVSAWIQPNLATTLKLTKHPLSTSLTAERIRAGRGYQKRATPGTDEVSLADFEGAYTVDMVFDGVNLSLIVSPLSHTRDRY